MTEEKKLYVYYYSDPDATEKELRCHALYTDIPFTDLPWRVHSEKPADALVDPIWSMEVGGWVENSKDSQGAILVKQSEQIDTLTKTNEEKDKAISDLQKTIQASAQATSSLGMQFNQFGTQITTTLKQVTDSINELRENGGTK